MARASLQEAAGLFESACKPGSVACSHSSGIRVAANLKQPTRVRCGPHLWTPIWPCSEWGLPSPWTVASHAVRSYRTFSTLPATRGPLRRFPFCCTFRRLAPPRRYLALRPVEPGLSSLPVRNGNSDCIADSAGKLTASAAFYKGFIPGPGAPGPADRAHCAPGP